MPLRCPPTSAALRNVQGRLPFASAHAFMLHHHTIFSLFGLEKAFIGARNPSWVHLSSTIEVLYMFLDLAAKRISRVPRGFDPVRMK